MKAFRHVNARSVAEAGQLLASYREKARIQAGGTDLIGALKDRILPVYPEVLINLKTVGELRHITPSESHIEIGALTTLAEVIQSPLLARHWPLVQQACREIASPQIRNVATVGGNLCQDVRCWYYRYPDEIGGRIPCFRREGKSCPAVAGENQYHAVMNAKRCHAVCPSDIAVALTAIRATLDIAGVNGGRVVAVEEFFTPGGNVLADDEFVRAVRIPQPERPTRQRFLKFAFRKPIDFSVVSAASCLDMDGEVCTDARLVLGAVAYAPVRVLEAEQFLLGKVIDDKTASQAADLALSNAKPLSRNAYKVNISKSLVKTCVSGFGE